MPNKQLTSRLLEPYDTHTWMKWCSYELYTVVCIQRSGEEGSDDILTVVKCVRWHKHGCISNGDQWYGKWTIDDILYDNDIPGDTCSPIWYVDTCSLMMLLNEHLYTIMHILWRQSWICKRSYNNTRYVCNCKLSIIPLGDYDVTIYYLETSISGCHSSQYLPSLRSWNRGLHLVF